MYTGNSIVDYLNSVGQNSSYSSRSQLAASKGINGYTGSAAQNTQLLNLLRTPTTAVTSPNITTPTQQPQQSQPQQSVAPQPQINASFAPGTAPANAAPQPQPQMSQAGQPAPQNASYAPGTEPQPQQAPLNQPLDPVQNATQALPSSYAGSSVVDYLSSVGKPADFASRATLAKDYGISNYTGTASQNTQLLNKLRSQGVSTGSSPVGGAIAGLTESTPQVQPDGTVSTDPEQSSFQSDVQSIMEQFGITSPSGSQSPQTSFADTYGQVYSNMGLGAVKAQYDDYSKQYGELQNKKTDEMMAINNDPWLTEGVRVERLRKLDSKYELRENNLLGQIKLAETMYDNGRQDAQFITSGILEQSGRTQSLNEALIMKAIDIAESREEARRTVEKPDKPTATIQEYEYAKSQGYQGSFQDFKNEGSSGLNPGQINSTVNSIAGAFDNEPLVKDYNQANSQYQLMSSIGSQTSNPGDDIAFVYAFAKLMDPNSVVREGEYATIQKYAQSFLNRNMLNAVRLVSNQNFLTADAKQKLLTTASAKIRVLESQYSNVRNEYQRQINDAYSGSPRQITNYNQSSGSSSGGGLYDF